MSSGLLRNPRGFARPAPELLSGLDEEACRSHGVILASLAGYNVVAILLFLIPNSPTLYPRIKSAQSRSWNVMRHEVGKSSLESNCRAHLGQNNSIVLRRDFHNNGFPLLTLGHIVLTSAAPLVIGILVT